MDYSELYRSLIDNIDNLYREKSDRELYELGKQLPFIERLNYDYKIRSIKEKFEFLDFFSEFYNRKNFINKLIDNDELNYIINNFEKISSYDFETKEPIIKYINKNIDKIKKEDLEKIKYFIVYNMFEKRYDLEEDDINKVKNIIDSISKKEKLSILDINKIGYGSYSNIYKIGNKVIKIGYKRNIDKIVDNNRILLPDEFINIKDNIIEITDYIDDKSDFTKDEIYEVYKDLREQGIIWMDPSKDNLKRIDNINIEIQKEKSKNRNKYPFIKNKRIINRPLKSNDLVIIDLDHLVEENNKGRIYVISEYLREDILSDREKYEKRYLLEKKKTI